ncbi:phospholipase effector Tle1 domain-containing protein, partial [Solilutibacter pythonis]
MDDVSHYEATPEHLRSFDQASDQLSKFKAPQLFNQNDVHSHLLIGLMDGTGNDITQDPMHATNVSKFEAQIFQLNNAGNKRIHAEYIEGPGTQTNFFEKGVDSATGYTSLARAEEMYTRLVEQADEIHKVDPNAKIAIHLEGFSRGASQVPLLARMIDERGIPDKNSLTVTLDENGALAEKYTRYHQPPGQTPLTVGLYDPVPTGYMEMLDRRLPSSTVSGFQITAANERRGLFPVDQIIPEGLSEDGRFLNVTVAGAHSDVGGSYIRNGLGIRSFNLMTDYHNRLLGDSILPRLHEPEDPRMNVIHR